MNRIFKVIWSKAKQCRVVVSEIAKSCVNVSESHKKILASGILLLLMLGGNCGISYAGWNYSHYTQLRNDYRFKSSISSTDQQII